MRQIDEQNFFELISRYAVLEIARPLFLELTVDRTANYDTAPKFLRKF